MEMAYEQLQETSGNPYRLGRHINHDERSMDFPFSATEEAQAPVKAIEWQRRVGIFDQGQLGSCTGNAAGGWLGTDNAVRQGLTQFTSPGDSGALDEKAAVEIYHEATVIDPYPGTYPPDDTGSDGLSVTKVLKNLGYVDTYSHIFDAGGIQVALQSTPVLIGVKWYQGMFTPDSKGVVTVSGALAGGHEILICGYDADGSLGFPAPYKIANSWGTGWGDNGFFYISEATLDQLLQDQGDATVPHAVGSTPTPPPSSKTITGVLVTHNHGRPSHLSNVQSLDVTFSDGTTTHLP